MKKLSKQYLRKLIVEELSILTEEEDEGMDIFGGGEEEEGGDEGGEEEDAAEDTEEGGDEEGGEEGGDEASDEGGDEEAEEGGDEEAASESEAPEDAATGPSDSGVDVELNSLLADFEAQALAVTKSATPEYDVVTQESFSPPSLASILFEGEEAAAPALDIPTYTSNVARLIQNYQSLMDMEKMIFTKSRDFLASKYGEEMALEFEESLEKDHGITFDPEGLEQNAPAYAVGAMNAQA